MFQAGQRVAITVIEGGTDSTHMNMVVVACEEGLLRVHPVGDASDVTVFNMRSFAFVKASLQK